MATNAVSSSGDVVTLAAVSGTGGFETHTIVKVMCVLLIYVHVPIRDSL
jgi:hypothetical protein